MLNFLILLAREVNTKHNEYIFCWYKELIKELLLKCWVFIFNPPPKLSLLSVLATSFEKSPIFILWTRYFVTNSANHRKRSISNLLEIQVHKFHSSFRAQWVLRPPFLFLVNRWIAFEVLCVLSNSFYLFLP